MLRGNLIKDPLYYYLDSVLPSFLTYSNVCWAENN